MPRETVQMTKLRIDSIPVAYGLLWVVMVLARRVGALPLPAAASLA